MSLRFSKVPLRLALIAVVFGAGSAQRADAAAAIGFCIDESSPSAGVDATVAKAVADKVGVSPRLVYFDGSKGGESTGFQPRKFRELAESQCDLIMGIPVDAASSDAPAGLQHTRGYVDTGFVLLKQGTAVGLDQLPRGSHVAVVYNTPPHLLFVDRPGLRPVIYESDDDGLRAVAAHAVDAAIIWQPSVAKFRTANAAAASLTSSRLDTPYTRWTLSALYAPRAQAAARTFDDTLASLESSGALGRITQDYALPPPVTVAAAGQEPEHEAETSQEAEHSESSVGIYSSEQAERGAKVYAQYCAACHGDHMQGVVGPALKGHSFASVEDEFTIGAMFTFLSTQMPAGAPSSLTHEQYADLMAFVLKENGYPSGPHPLSYEDAMSSEAPLVSKVEGAAPADTGTAQTK